MGGDTKSTDTTQSSQTNPWAPTQPMLQQLLSNLGGKSTSVTPGQSTALSNLQNSANNLPDLSGAVTGATTNALGTNTGAQQGMLGSAYQSYLQQMLPTASGANLNPMNVPGFSNALNTMTQDT